MNKCEFFKKKSPEMDDFERKEKYLSIFVKLVRKMFYRIPLQKYLCIFFHFRTLEVFFYFEKQIAFLADVHSNFARFLQAPQSNSNFPVIK